MTKILRTMSGDVVVDDPNVALTVVEGIEIGSVGEAWPASTGPFTLTQEHIQSIIASQADPVIKAPRVKLGHVDPRFTPDGNSPDIFDGQPVFGKFVNLRTDEAGLTLIGDITGIPKWTAQVLPYAWPSRSGEWYEDWDNYGTAQAQWPMVLTAVALLGVELPAIATIEDLPALFTAEGPPGVRVVVDGEKIRAAAARKESMGKIKTSVGTDAVRNSFFEDFAQGDRYWWWPQQVYIDPMAVVACDDETGDLYFISYTISGDSVAWGEPVPVKHQYVAEDGGKVMASTGRPKTYWQWLTDGHQPAAVYSKAAEVRPAERKRTTTQESDVRINVRQLRERLGLDESQLPDDATEEQINEILDQDPVDDGNPGDEDEQEHNAEDDGSEDDAEIGEEDDGAAEETAEAGELVHMSRAQHQQMTARLEQLEKDAEKRTKRETRARRDRIVTEAVRTGRIAPSEREHYRSLLDIDEDKTNTQIKKLTAGRIPIKERGVSTSSEAPAAEGTGWFNHDRKAS